MNIIEKTYSVFLCLTRDDEFGDRHKRAAMALEMVTTFLLSFFIMIIIGLLNFKITNILVWGLIIVLIAFSTYLFFNRYLIKSERYIGIVEEEKQYSKKKKNLMRFYQYF
ncbi:MAG: hypothetical protein U9R54_10030 [Bacteroidota bacterium]|nr:hypothetical protein [Bacteroidota bacterium]